MGGQFFSGLLPSHLSFPRQWQGAGESWVVLVVTERRFGPTSWPLVLLAQESCSTCFWALASIPTQWHEQVPGDFMAWWLWLLTLKPLYERPSHVSYGESVTLVQGWIPVPWYLGAFCEGVTNDGSVGGFTVMPSPWPFFRLWPLGVGGALILFSSPQASLPPLWYPLQRSAHWQTVSPSSSCLMEIWIMPYPKVTYDTEYNFMLELVWLSSRYLMGGFRNLEIPFLSKQNLQTTVLFFKNLNLQSKWWGRVTLLLSLASALPPDHCYVLLPQPGNCNALWTEKNGKHIAWCSQKHYIFYMKTKVKEEEHGIVRYEEQQP